MTVSKKSKPLTDMFWDKIYTDSYSSLIFLLNLFANFPFREIKKAECWRIDAFELWCWRRLLRVPWTARRSNQSILKESSPEYSLGGLMLKLKLQYSGHLMWRTDSLEKTLMLGKVEGMRRRGGQDEMVGRHHWLDDGLEFEQALGDGERQGSLVCSLITFHVNGQNL